jgi:hypothetical protein
MKHNDTIKNVKKIYKYKFNILESRHKEIYPCVHGEEKTNREKKRIEIQKCFIYKQIPLVYTHSHYRIPSNLQFSNKAYKIEATC